MWTSDCGAQELHPSPAPQWRAEDFYANYIFLFAFGPGEKQQTCS